MAGITKQRLRDAISAFDLNGNAKQRVLEAANNYLTMGLAAGAKGLYKDSAEKCLLAHAWNVAYVDKERFVDYISTGGLEVVHPFSDVVEWFDSFPTNEAAVKAIIFLLEKEDGEENNYERETYQGNYALCPCS